MENLEDDGFPTPALDEQPDLFPDLLPFWTAFLKLNSSRRLGFGTGPIPLSEIVAYLDLHYITLLEDRLEYEHWVQFLDNSYLKEVHSNKSKEKKSKGTSKKSNGRNNGRIKHRNRSQRRK